MSADQRPVTVTVAALLQALSVLLAVGASALAWKGAAIEEDRYFAVFVTALAVMVVGWFGGTLPAVLRRSNTGRIMAAIGAAFYQVIVLTLCVCGGMFAFLTLPFRMAPEGFESSGFGEVRFTDEPDTPWQLFASGMSFVVIGIALFAAMVLLLVPPSHRWYVAARRASLGDGGTVSVR
jgi:hypothetical protein